MQLRWYEPVLYYNYNASYPKTKEEPGYFVGLGENVGDAPTLNILTHEDNYDYYKSLWDVHRVLRNRGELKKVELYVESRDPDKKSNG